MTSRLRELFSLEHSTAETEHGPIMDLRRDALVLRYDAEGDDGVVWTRLHFAPVFATRFTADPIVQAWMIDAYSKVCEVEASSWIEEIIGAAQEGRGAVESARHFVIYFDDFGCVEVAAGDIEVVIENNDAG